MQGEKPSCQYHGNNAQTLSCLHTESIDPPFAATSNIKEKGAGEDPAAARHPAHTPGNNALSRGLSIPQSRGLHGFELGRAQSLLVEGK